MAWWLHFVGYYFFRRVGLALGLAPRDREVGRLPVFAGFIARSSKARRSKIAEVSAEAEVVGVGFYHPEDGG